MQRFDFNLLIALVALLETCSVTQSSERLNLSVPATSRVLGRLREVFGDPLLVRAGARLVATPRALALLQPARDALAAIVALPEAESEHGLAGVRHRFFVRLPDPMSVVLAAPLSAALAEAMPDARLALVSEVADVAGALRDGRVDIVVGADLPVLAELRAEALSEQALVGVVRTDHPLAKGRLTVGRIAATGRVQVQAFAGSDDPMDEALGRHGLQSPAVLSVPSPYAALAVASASDLLACVPERIAQAVAPSLRLQVLKLPFPLPGERLAIGWHRRTDTALGHAWLRGRLREMIERRPPQGRSRDLTR